MNGRAPRTGRHALAGANGKQHEQPAVRRESFAPVEGGKKKKKKGKAQPVSLQCAFSEKRRHIYADAHHPGG